MKVIVISPTIQEFNGERFYLCGKYFQHKGRRLHVMVWRYHNGEPPKGYHVHHIDENRSNNQIENLALLESAIHMSKHASEREDYNRQHIEDIRDLAEKWHGSEAGREWHGEHAKEYWKKAPERDYVCTNCGKPFKSKNVYSPDSNTFCSNACKTMHRAHSGIDNEDRTCPVCGRTFSVNKYARRVCCSRECAVKKRWNR